jgi:hypothetical protein
MGWIKMPSTTTWTDGISHYVLAIQADTSNRINVFKVQAAHSTCSILQAAHLRRTLLHMLLQAGCILL